jgi:hypothetical protein
VSAKYESLSQEEFRTRWRNADAPGYFAAMAELIKVRRSCNALAEVDRVLQTFQRDEARMRLIESQLETVSTELTATGSLDPNNDYTISITEHWRELDTGNTVDTVKSPQVHAFSPKTSIFTLSAGFLATRIDARKYVRRAVPGGADSDPVGNVLEVEGANKLRPTGIALLNFQIPRIGSDEIGLAFSVGPTVRIGAANDTSNLGVFAGPSLHLWRLIYLTAGWHLAEFADFPPGFFPGRAIPSNFQGDPQPLKRWTGRFGFAITFRTKDFGSIDKVKPTASQNTAEKKPETTKSETAKPAEAPKAENSKVDPNNPTPVPQPKK